MRKIRDKCRQIEKSGGKLGQIQKNRGKIVVNRDKREERREKARVRASGKQETNEIWSSDASNERR